MSKTICQLFDDTIEGRNFTEKQLNNIVSKYIEKNKESVQDEQSLREEIIKHSDSVEYKINDGSIVYLRNKNTKDHNMSFVNISNVILELEHIRDNDNCDMEDNYHKYWSEIAYMVRIYDMDIGVDED